MLSSLLWIQHESRRTSPPRVSVAHGPSEGELDALVEREATRAGGRAPVTPVGDVEFGGWVHIGTPGASVPYLGGGRLALTGAGGAPLRVEVYRGRFALRGAAGARPVVSGVELIPGPARLEGEVPLEAGHANVVHCTWARDLLLHVRAADTGRELPLVALLETRDRELDESGFGSAALGPRPDDSVLIDASPSPLSLAIPDAPNTEYWIMHEGYAPFRFRMPSALPPGEVAVSLQPAATVEVRVADLASRGEGLAVRVYRSGERPLRPVGEPLLSRAALDVTRITGLRAERLFVTLEDGSGARLDSQGVVTVPGTTTVVRLTPGTRRDDALGKATFTFQGLEGDLAGLGARLLPLGGEPWRGDPELLAARGPASLPGATWGPVALPAGAWVLQVGLTSQVFRFTLEPGEEMHRLVPLQAAREFHVDLVDARTGVRVHPRSFAWSMPLDFDGRFDPENAAAMRVARSSRPPIRIEVPAGRVRIQALTDGYGLVDEVLDLDDGSDPVLELVPTACLRVCARGIDQHVSLEWLRGATLVQRGLPVTIESADVVVDDSGPTGRLFFGASGLVEVRLPPLDSYGDVAPFTLDFGAGETVDVRLESLLDPAWR